MVSRLVLIRHGKAEEQEAGLADAERQLTAAGLLGVEARYPVSFQLLPEDAQDLQVWSSPLRRAMETAGVVASVLDVPAVKEHESLQSESVDRFLTELASENGTIVAVGHNPFMEELYERLSGNAQTMKPGAMACFGFDGESAGGIDRRGRLEWFIQGPEVALWQTIVDMEEALALAASRVDRCNSALLDNMDDPESLHQYRVSLEIAHALLNFVKPFCKRKVVKRTIRNIEGLLHSSRQLRDFDTLVEELNPAAQEAQALREAAMVEREDFHREFRANPTQKIVERIARQLREVPWRSATLEEGVPAEALAQRLSAMQQDFEFSLSQVPYDAQRAVYNVRKKARALQYVVRELLMCLPDDAGSIGMRAEAVQKRLGELCDCWNNARFIVVVCGPSAINTAAHFVVQADAIVEDLKTGRAHGLSISDS